MLAEHPPHATFDRAPQLLQMAIVRKAHYTRVEFGSCSAGSNCIGSLGGCLTSGQNILEPLQPAAFVPPGSASEREYFQRGTQLLKFLHITLGESPHDGPGSWSGGGEPFSR